jgi:hypothetical protein
MKGIKAIIAGAGALSLASFGVFGGGSVGAISAVRLTDNPDSATSVTVKHVITNGLGNISGDITYRFAPCSNFADLSTPAGIVDVISFDNVAVNENNEAEASVTFDLSDLTFGAAGSYEFCINEFGSSNQAIIADTYNRYRFFIDVMNEKDADGEYTGNLVANLSPLALNDETGEKGEAVFTSEQQLTHIEIAHKVLGDKANFDQYFGYKLRFDWGKLLPADEEILISGIDEYYTDPDTGELKKNLTSIKSNETGYIYLKKDQVAIIGVENGKNRLPADLVYDIEVGNRTQFEAMYSSRFNDDTTGLTALRNLQIVLEPGEGASEAEIARYNSSNKVLVTRTMEAGVSTGVVTKLMPFVALTILGSAIVLAFKYYSNKTRKNGA